MNFSHVWCHMAWDRPSTHSKKRQGKRGSPCLNPLLGIIEPIIKPLKHKLCHYFYTHHHPFEPSVIKTHDFHRMTKKRQIYYVICLTNIQLKSNLTHCTVVSPTHVMNYLKNNKNIDKRRLSLRVNIRRDNFQSVGEDLRKNFIKNVIECDGPEVLHIWCILFLRN